MCSFCLPDLIFALEPLVGEIQRSDSFAAQNHGTSLGYPLTLGMQCDIDLLHHYKKTDELCLLNVTLSIRRNKMHTMYCEKFNSLSVFNFFKALQQVTQGAPSIREEGEQVSAGAAART